jgi:hypothetical protein
MPLFESLQSVPSSSTSAREALYSQLREITADFTDEELAKLVEHSEMTKEGIMARRAHLAEQKN